MILSFNTIVLFTITNSTVRLLIRIAFKTTRGRTTTNTATVHDDHSHHSSYFYVSSFSQWTERTAKRRKKVGKLLKTITFPTEMITTDHRMNNNLPIQIGSKYYPDFLACSSSTTSGNKNENATVNDTEETAAATAASTELPLLRLLRIPVLTSAPKLDWNTLHPSLDPHASISRSRSSSGNNNNTSSKSGRRKTAPTTTTTTATATTNPTTAVVITPRAQRKRRAVEAFYHIIQTLYPPPDHTNPGNDNKPGTKKEKKHITIFDAASGAGGLTVPLAGLLASSLSSSNTTTSTTNTYRIVAIDMNAIALQRLKTRDTTHTIETICADLATFQIPTSIDSVVNNNNNNNNSISSDTNTANNKSAENPPILICSLHGCGAVTDFAIDIATRHRLPFCVSSCCTAKAITKRQAPKPTAVMSTSTPTSITKKGRMVSVLLSSKERSAAPAHITYPRSDWLQQQLLSLDNTNDTDKNNEVEEKQQVATAADSSSHNNTTTKSHPYYSTIAKVADIGLGPQTPLEQLGQQRKAKQIVEMDRVMGVLERYPNTYTVQMYEIKDHDDAYYGKREIIVGIPLPQ